MICPYGIWQYNYNEDKEYVCKITGAGCAPPSTKDGVEKCAARVDKEWREIIEKD